MQSLTNELQELNNAYNELRKKIEAMNNKISARKSIQSLLGFFGLILFLFLGILFGGIILTIVINTFNQYFDWFLILGSILVIVYIIFFGVSRIIVKNISTYSILRDKLSEQSEEEESKINKIRLLIDREEETSKKLETQENVPGNESISLDLKQTNKGNENELIYEEEQKEKGLIKFVPISLEIKQLLKEEGHDKSFKSKISKKLKNPEGVPSEITWGTPEQVSEWTQKEKGYTKFVDDSGKIKWGTEKQIAKWQKEKNKKPE